MSRSRFNRNLTVIFVTILVNVTFIFTWTPLLPLHLRALGANDWEIGIAFTAMGIARTLFAVVGGALADRYGRRLVLTLPQFISAFLYLSASLMTDWLALVVILVGGQALNALTSPPFNAILAESVPGDRMARAFSIAEAGVLIGLIAGPLAGAALVPYVSIPLLITVYGVILLFTTTARFVGIHDLGRPTHAAALPKIRAALNARVGWYIVAFTLVNMAFGICFGPYFAILAHDVWKSTDSEINLLFALGSAASLLGIPFGQRADRWGTQRVVTIGLFVFAITVAAWGFASSWQWGIAPIVLAFFFSEGAIIAVLALQGQITTRESRASVMGVIATASGVVAGLGPTLAAGLTTWGGVAAPFVACGVMSLLAIGAVRRIERTPRAQLVGAEAK